MDKKDLDHIPALLDYLFGRDEPQQRQKIEKLILADEKVRKLFYALKNTLDPLSELPEEAPPLGLAERTLKFVTQKEQECSVAASIAQPTILLDKGDMRRDRSGSRLRWVLGNVRDVVAVAACILLVFTLLRPTLQMARQKSQQMTCSNQLSAMGTALNNYAVDYNGLYPYLPRSEGMTGQHVSNTQGGYLLVRLGYLQPEKFLCPGVDSQKVRVQLRINPQKFKELNDFLSREYVNYSFRLIVSPQPFPAEMLNSAIPIASDQNPIFVGFDSSKMPEIDLTKNTSLLQENSPNHGKLGQNLLFPDNSVRFFTDRFFGPGGDDGFTIDQTMLYRGWEFPKSDKDIFIR
ncbi:MAG: DUF1559 domain-containing protein [Planctomycetes bacterium]|nr:DUF1559 domain-containing protein [Planctomycetota bacterium]